ncbi:hypothetical protein Tsubulata_019688 [Turnera subulata]|uniref:RRM domain-containing protein n=1 Tax=Turnera subulata TaxID=218843 RepID=A0A9Q0IYV2_9ROSI|nr:hypothetical protein Tsubulata_019688 [Turnera subulata]
MENPKEKTQTPHLQRQTTTHTPPIRPQTQTPPTPPTQSLGPQPTPPLTTPFFSKWNREQVQRAVDSGEAVSLYVENFAPEWKPVDIYRIMSKYGEVMDVFVPRKKTRQGKIFCFVRFRGVKDVQRLINDVNRIHVEEGVIVANLARRREWTGTQKREDRPGGVNGRVYSRINAAKTFAASVKDSNPSESDQGFTFIPTSDTLNWLARCAVGVLHHPADMESIQHVWALHGFKEVKVSDLGGNKVLVCFTTKEAMIEFTQTMPEWVQLWLSTLKPWQRGEHITNRRCWLSIRGVPLIAWCNDFFSLVGSLFGTMIRVDSATEHREHLEEARVEVLTLQREPMSKHLKVKITGMLYDVYVVEIPKVAFPCSIADDRHMADNGHGDDSPAHRADQGQPHMESGRGMMNAGTDEDPFVLMPVIEGRLTGVGKEGLTAKTADDRASGNCVDSPPMIMRGSSPHGMLVINSPDRPRQRRDLIMGTNSASSSNTDLAPIHVFNPFGPLVDYEDSESESPMAFKSQQPSSGVGFSATPHTHNNTLNKTGSGNSSFSLGRMGGESPVRCHSSDAGYIRYLEQKLDKAIKTGRVSRGRKFKKVLDTGSVVSINSSGSSDIRRVNLRLSQQLETSQQNFSFTRLEAEETVQVGNALGWEVSPDQNEVIEMAKTLVEKEAHEWSLSRANV